MRLLRRLSYAALAFGFLHIVFGAIVRISGSGLGCGDHWPKCHGWWIPPLRRMDLIIEVSHRYLAAGLTTTVLLLLAAALLARREPGVGGRGGVLRPAALATVLVITAALLGAVVVKLELHNKYIIVVHLAIAMSLLATVAVATVRAGGLGSLAALPGGASRKTFRAAAAAAGLAFVAVAFGGLTANVIGANGACQGFPTCSQGVLAHGTPLYVHVVHRVLAFLLLFHTLGVAIGVTRRGESLLIRRAARIVFGTVILQIVVAAALVELHLPAPLRSLHEAVGTLVWLTAFVFAALALRASVDGNPAVLEPVRPSPTPLPLARPASAVPASATLASAVATTGGSPTTATLDALPATMAATSAQATPVEPLATAWMGAAAALFADAPVASSEVKSLFDERVVETPTALDAIEDGLLSLERGDDAAAAATPERESHVEIETVATSAPVVETLSPVAALDSGDHATDVAVVVEETEPIAVVERVVEHVSEARPIEPSAPAEVTVIETIGGVVADAITGPTDVAEIGEDPAHDMAEPALVGLAEVAPEIALHAAVEAAAEPTHPVVETIAAMPSEQVAPAEESLAANEALSVATDVAPDTSSANEPPPDAATTIADAAPDDMVSAFADELAEALDDAFAEPMIEAGAEEETDATEVDDERNDEGDDAPNEGVLVARGDGAVTPRAYSALLEPPSLEEIDADEALADAPWLAEALALDATDLEWETRAPVLRPIAPAAQAAAARPPMAAVAPQPPVTLAEAVARRRGRPPTLAVLIARGADF